MATSPPFEFATFARHQDRLRTFVIALGADEHSADDVVQDVWLRASREGERAGPAAPEATWSWLRSIARRVAGNHHRANARRRVREHRAARDEALPSSAELAAEVELHRRVLDVLASLAEPHRTLLRDHHLGGLTILQLASRADISPHTMKDRLVRARTEMRCALKRAGIDQRSRAVWLAPLAPRKTAAPLTLTGTLAMKATIAIAAAVLAVTAWLLWSPPGNAPDAVAAQRSPSAIDSAPTGVAELAPANIESSRSAVATSKEAEPASPQATLDWIVRGQVWLYEGAPGPRPDVTVHLAAYDGGEIAGEPFAKTTVTSNTAGSFEWALEDPGRTVSIEALVDPIAGFTISTAGHRVAIIGEGPMDTIVVRVNPHDACIEGTVRASNKAADPGAPIAGARVDFNHSVTHTDDAGAFRLNVPSRGYGSLICTAEGFHQGGDSPGGRKPGVTSRFDIELDPEFGAEGTVFGYVRDSRGRVLPGATVETWSSRETSVRADSTGYYKLTGIDLGPEHFVPITAAHPEYASVEAHARGPVDLSEHPGGMQLDFELVSGARVHGTVVDAAGEPVQGAALWIGPHANLVANRRTYTDTNGVFSVPRVGPGKMLLGAQKRGQPEFVQDLHVLAEDTEKELSIVFDRTTPLRGQVVDSEGKPLAGALVFVRTGAYERSRGDSCASKADGSYELPGIAAGKIEVTARLAGYVPRMFPHEHDGDPLAITLERKETLKGRVVDAASGDPIESFHVRILPPEDRALGPWFSGMEISWVADGYRFSDALGHWSTGDVDPIQTGVWTLVEVRADGYEPLQIGPFQVPSQGEAHDLVHRLVAR